MNNSKEKLVRFIEKYSLQGKIDSAVLTIENKNLSTLFKTVEGDLVGRISMSDVKLESNQLGIYTTASLLKMLSILEGNITVEYIKGVDDKVKTLVIRDVLNKKIKYATCNLEIIDSDVKWVKTFDKDIKIKLEKNLINDILKASSAINSKGITFLNRDSKLYLIYNYSEGNDDQIELEIDAEIIDDNFESMTFDLSNFKSIIEVNSKKYEEAELIICSKGFAYISFKDEDSFAEYLLIKFKD